MPECMHANVSGRVHACPRITPYLALRACERACVHAWDRLSATHQKANSCVTSMLPAPGAVMVASSSSWREAVVAEINLYLGFPSLF